jgi:hypothetical protein
MITLNTLEEQQAFLEATPPYPEYRTIAFSDGVVLGTYHRGAFVKLFGTSKEVCLDQFNKLNDQPTP